MIKGQEDKKIDIDQLIKYRSMSSYCLKCKKKKKEKEILKTLIQEFQRLAMVKQ